MALVLGFIPGAAWTWGLVEATKPLVFPPGAHADLVVAFLLPRGENQTALRSVPGAHWLDSSEAPTGLCVFILHNHHLNLNS